MFSGPVAGDRDASAADARLFGHDPWAWPGRFRGTIALGDLDGDGRDDLAIGDHRAGPEPGDDRGAVYVVRGQDVAGQLDLPLAATATLTGSEPDEVSGATVAFLGDTDGDGLGELLIGAPGAAGVDFGSWWVGYGLTGGLDLTGDALPDLVLGARGAIGDVVGSGAVFVVPGER